MTQKASKNKNLWSATILTSATAFMMMAALSQPALAQTVKSTDTSAATDNSSDPNLNPSAADTTDPNAADVSTAKGPQFSADDISEATVSQRDNLRIGSLSDRTTSLDGLRRKPAEADPSGMRIGSFILRTSVGNGIGVEKTVSGGTSSTRTYLQTDGKGELVSDWDLHELRVTATGIWQKNIGGSGETNPSANLDAKLRLDVDRLTTLNFTGGYHFYRETSTDPNSISGANVQSGVNQLVGGVEAKREFGQFRGTVGASVTRNIYGAATLNDGTNYSMSDRNETTGELRMRIGYQISPALTPFVEGSVGRLYYDQTLDRSGYNRNASYAGLKAGTELDLGEKLRGELAAGYKTMTFRDSRLASINALTIDGSTTWSPLRGTDVTLGVSTGIDPSTTAGVSGSTYYALNAAVAHEMIDNLVARLSGSATFWNFKPSGIIANQHELVADMGLTWSMNSSVDLAGDLIWDRTEFQNAGNSTVWKAIASVRVKR